MGIVKSVEHINSDTGEVYSRRETTLPEYFHPENGYRLMARTKALRVFPQVDLPKALSRVDMGHLYFLTRSTWASTGCLGVVKARKFTPFNDEELYKHIGFTNDRKGRDWLRKMDRLSMLRSIDVNLPDGEKERQWYVNPVYFCPMFISRQAYLIWHDQIEKLMPEYAKRLLQ